MEKKEKILRFWTSSSLTFFHVCTENPRATNLATEERLKKKRKEMGEKADCGNNAFDFAYVLG